MTAKLAASGFTTARAAINIGHNPWRMTFVARQALASAFRRDTGTHSYEVAERIGLGRRRSANFNRVGSNCRDSEIRIERARRAASASKAFG